MKFLGILFVSMALCGIGYYFLIYQPQVQQLLANKERCSEIGQVLDQKEQQSNAPGTVANTMGQRYMWGKFAYSQTLNTCLYSYAVNLQNPGDDHSMFIATIVDSTANQTILSSGGIFYNAQGNFRSDADKTKFDTFFQQEDALMGTHDSAELAKN